MALQVGGKLFQVLGTALTGVLWRFRHRDALIAGLIWAGIGIIYAVALSRATGKRLSDLAIDETPAPPAGRRPGLTSLHNRRPSRDRRNNLEYTVDGSRRPRDPDTGRDARRRSGGRRERQTRRKRLRRHPRPALDQAISMHGKLRVVLIFAGKFGGMEPGALWQDLKMGIQDWSAWERLALVTDHTWVKDATKLFSWAIPGQVKVFDVAEQDDAIAWAAST